AAGKPFRQQAGENWRHVLHHDNWDREVVRDPRQDFGQGGPPVEVPMATISMRGLERTRTLNDGRVPCRGRRFNEDMPHSALILGMSSIRMCSSATAGLPGWLGMVGGARGSAQGRS